MGIKNIVKKLTINEKLRMLTGYDGFSAIRLPEKGVCGVQMADGPYGVKTQDGRSTCFLNTCLMASSWDREVCYEIGKMLGAECKQVGVDVLLAPAINIKRHPLCGRNFEYYSEDPVLTGVLASEYIKGIKSEGTGTCIKHYACYSQETMRWVLNCYIDDDTMRNIYLKAFEIAIQEANPEMVMASYSRINDIPATEHAYLLKDILRDEWGYSGVVVSDWCAVEDLVSAFKNGLDLEMPGNIEITLPILQKAFENGQLTEAEIDEKVERLLRLEQACADKPTTETTTNGERLRKVTGEAFVLLKNDNVLPVLVGERLLIVGAAKEPKMQGGGCAKMKTNVAVSPLEEIQKQNKQCDYIQGYKLTQETLDKLNGYDKVVVFLSMPEDSDSEAFDRKDFSFPKEQTDCLQTVSRFNENVIVVMQNGSVVDVSFAQYAKGILETYYAGSYGGGAIADVLFGKTTPSGRLTESFPIALQDVPSNDYFGEKANIVYAEKEFVGYRYYTTYGIKTAYPFGYGLSYCDFRIENVCVTKTAPYEFDVSLEIYNNSSFEGKETIQIYLRSKNPFEPKMQLLDFCKIGLQKGERKHCSIRLSPKNFERYIGGKKRLIEGEYAICVARSSENIIAEYWTEFKEQKPKIIDEKMPLGEFLTNEKYRPIVLRYLLNAIKIWAYGDAKAEGDFEMDEFLRCSVYNMPIRAFLYFSDGKFDGDTIEKLLNELKSL